MNERIRLFFSDAEKVERYLAEPRSVYSRIQRISKELSDITPKDLFVKVCGVEKCASTKQPTAGEKALNSIHYVIDGKGTFIVKGKEYRLTKGSVFCAMRNLENVYYPDKDEPWTYAFIGLGGVIADSIVGYLGLNDDHCVIPQDKAAGLRDAFLDTVNAFNEDQTSSFKTLSCLYALIAELENICCPKKRTVSQPNRYLFNTLACIRNIGVNATADEVAKAVGLNRIYLSRLIRRKTGLSLRDMIISMRLFIARDYLEFGDKRMSIKEIANLSGYEDVKYFVRLFRSVFGVSPKEYRDNYDKKLIGS